MAGPDPLNFLALDGRTFGQGWMRLRRQIIGFVIQTERMFFVWSCIGDVPRERKISVDNANIHHESPCANGHNMNAQCGVT